jgi:ketosteroid isomerase-like protein
MALLGAVAALALGAFGPPAPAPLQIDEVERAFAQAVAQSGIAPGFRQFAAPDAVMFLPDPTPAVPQLSVARWPGELLWRPQYVAVSPGGDMAFSAGPSLLRTAGRASGGFYLTVWRRQPDRSWKFVLDHGVDLPAYIWSEPRLPLTVLTAAPVGGPPSNEGMREADGSLNVALPKGAVDAFSARLDDQALVVRTNRPPASRRGKALALIADSPPILEAFTLGGARSSDGEFGYTYGRARWVGTAGAQLGYYVRVWRATPKGWRLLADHLAER